MLYHLRFIALGAAISLCTTSTHSENDSIPSAEAPAAHNDDQLLQKLFLEAKRKNTPYGEIAESWLNSVFLEEGDKITFNFSYEETNADWALTTPLRADECQLSGSIRSVNARDLTSADRLNGLLYIARFTISTEALRTRSMLAGLDADWSKWYESEGNVVSGEVTFTDREAHVESRVQILGLVLPAQLGTGASVASEYIKEKKAADEASAEAKRKREEAFRRLEEMLANEDAEESPKIEDPKEDPAPSIAIDWGTAEDATASIIRSNSTLAVINTDKGDQLVGRLVPTEPDGWLREKFDIDLVAERPLNLRAVDAVEAFRTARRAANLQHGERIVVLPSLELDNLIHARVQSAARKRGLKYDSVSFFAGRLRANDFGEMEFEVTEVFLH